MSDKCNLRRIVKEEQPKIFNCLCDADDDGVCMYKGQCEYQSSPLHGSPPQMHCMVNEAFYWRYY
jgi:hypothetical protein